MASGISKSRIAYEGPESYDIICVGEAPGGEEMGQGRPFIGKAGQHLEHFLERQGVLRHQVKLANLCNYRPPGNQFKALLKSWQLQEGLEELAHEIKRAKPNVIIALGGWPLYYLTGKCGHRQGKSVPGSGILNYRGSRLPAKEEFGGGKVFVTTHPSYLNYVWRWNPVFSTDLKHAVEDSKFPELRYPEYEEFIDPPGDKLFTLTRESLEAEFVSVDIETFPNQQFSCVGWAYKKDEVWKGVCITFQSPDLWSYAKQVWESSTPKIFQYGTYDIPFMRRFYDWKIGGYYDGVGWDTYVASASIMPDYPRGLDFLASLYTRFPYYKSDRKVWKQKSDMNILWKYNIKDTVATGQIAYKQMGEIEELFG